MDTEIGHLGYSITLASLPPHFLNIIKNELLVKPLENPNFPSNDPAYPVYRMSKSKIYLPRFYGLEKYGPPRTNRLREGLPIKLEFKGTLRAVQESTIEATLKNDCCGLISLDTGLGKTVVALKLISLVATKTLVVVHADFLLDQWISRIKEYLPTARIGVIKQERCEIEDCDIVVGMIQTIIKREYPKGTFDSFGMLQMDECHHIASRTFSTLFFKVQPKRLIGLSATPQRKDGLSKVLYWFLGPQIIEIKRETDKPSITFMFNDTRDYIEKFNRLGKVNIPEMITDISIKPERNQLILSKIMDLLKNSRKILVLSERRSHCEWFCEQLKTSGILAGLYLGGMKTMDRETTTNCNVILGTYQAAGEGFDVADLDTLILATPKSDVQQAVGRILRQKNANAPLVIDIVDQFSIFKAQYFKRRKFYRTSEFLIN
jgi:superfamily II DNA or RNA helicase